MARSFTFVMVLGLVLGISSSTEAQVVSQCGGPGPQFGDNGVATVQDIITIVDTVTIEDVTVDVNITTTFVGDMIVDLTSPDAISLNLHANAGGSNDNLLVTFTDGGVPNGSEPYDCNCAMQPASGVFTAFDGSSSVGDWLLDIEDTFPTSGGGMLEEWCVNLYDVQLPTPVTNILCSSENGSGIVDVTWTNSSTYDEINVHVNGAIESTIAGGDTAYSTSLQPVPSTAAVCIEGVVGGNGTALICCTIDLLVEPVTGLGCTPNGDVADVSWTNPMPAYDAINVYVNGSVQATIAGDATSYTSLPVVGPFPANVDICVSGVVNGVESVLVCCAVLFAGPADLQECNAPGLPVDSGLPPTVDTLDVGTGFQIGDFELLVAITHTFQGDMTIDVTSPSGTSIRLHDQGGGANDDINVLYSDAGIPNADPYDCFCAMQPSGPGAMADVVDENTAGIWTLTVTDLAGGDIGTLNSWCVRFDEGCPTPPPSDLTCTDGGGDVSLAWVNPATYDSIDVEKDGAVVATLAGTATSYTDDDAGSGVHEYRVIGADSAQGCSSVSGACSLAVGITDLVWVPADSAGGLTDDAAGIVAALAANGINGVVQDSVLPGDLSGYERIWAVLGTFATNHTLTATEGQALADYATTSSGRLYVTGSDTWGFDAPTPLETVDGIDYATSTDGSPTCDLFTTTGLDSTQGLDLSTFALAPIGDSGGECAWIDHIVPTTAGPAMLNDGDLANVVVHHDANVSGTSNPGDYVVISSSFEFSIFADSAQRVTLMNLYLGSFGGGGPTGPQIVRGDADGNGGFNGLVDGLYALNFQFVPGAPTPPCLAQADADGNLSFNGLVDGLYMLNFQFVPGAPPIPAPFPGCGDDPDGVTALGCVTPACP